MSYLKPYFKIFFLYFLISCNKKPKLNIIEDAKYEAIDSFPKIEAFNGSFSKLSTNYLTNKKKDLLHYQKYYWDQNKRMSGGFLVAKNGEIIHEHYQGFSNKEDSTLINSTTPIHIASISKVLTSAAILKLIDLKKIQLNQKVASILPLFPYTKITIKMLLNHRSGLPNYTYFTSDKQIWDTHNLLSNQDILNLLNKNKFPLLFTPDTHFTYCNTNYAILALVIEKITGENYRIAMQKMIFKPLQMNDTYVFNYKKDTARASQSYSWKNQRYPFNYLDDIYGDKNIYSTPRDLLKFDLATYNKDFLNPKLKKQVYKGYSYEKKGVKNYGLGIRLKEWDTGQKLFYHNGWWHGNNSSYLHLYKDSTTIISLGNRYTRKIYSIMNLAGLFGDYPLHLEGEEKKDSILDTNRVKKITSPDIQKDKKEHSFDSILVKKEVILKDTASIIEKSEIELMKIDHIKNTST